MIKLFELNENKVIPTEHCYVIPVLKNIIDKYPDDYIKVFAFLFYTTCPDPVSNVYFNIPANEKEEQIIYDLDISFSTEAEAIINASKFCKDLYITPTVRAYQGISKMLDRLARYMETTEITHGRDGNINSIVSAAKNFQAIRESFKGVMKDLEDEQNKISVRGQQNLGYDQM
jgi:hypothetical protein